MGKLFAPYRGFFYPYRIYVGVNPYAMLYSPFRALRDPNGV